MPQPFQNAVITNAGASLLTRAQAGELSIEFTRIVIGDGIYTETEKEVSALQTQSALKSEQNSYPLSNIEVHNEHSIKVTTLITNQDPTTQETLVSSGYFINEMGLFAKVKGGDNDTEVLYSIAVTAGETGDFMPPYNGQYPAQIIQEYYATVNNSAEVIIQSNNGAVALADDLQKFFPKLNLDTEGYSYPSNCIYKQGLDLNEITESGLYFCSNPVNAPNNNGNGFMIAITYAGKTRGMQIYMPVGEDKIYKRQNTNDAWGAWVEIMTNTYAKKSIYDDSTVSLGRRSGTTVGNNSVVVGGDDSIASAPRSAILGGSKSTASGDGAVALGGYSVWSGNNLSVACGHHNSKMVEGGGSSNTTGTAFVIGNGTSYGALSNAFSVMFNGVVKAKSTITSSTTADYAEFFEWMDGNPNNEDRVGKFVTLVGNKIAIANSNEDYILGIVSGEPFVLGNGDCDTWNGMYMKDDFNRTIYESAPKMELDEETGEMVSVIDENGDLVYEGTRPKLNPKYDPDQPYISRFERKEWAPVGMLGVLSVIDDGSCQIDGFCFCNTKGIATACEKEAEGACRVIERVSENVIRVVLK